MSEPQQHHYIPEMLLRRFTDKNGKLYCFRKSSPKVFESTPEKAFKERHLYTQHDERGNKDVSTEIDLAKLEGQANEVIKKIIQVARRGELPSLTTSEKETWDEFCHCQFLRTPERRNYFQSITPDALYYFESEIRPLSDDEREKLNAPQEQHRFGNNTWVKIVGTPDGELLEILSNKKDIGIGIILNPTRSFIIGSNAIFFSAPPNRQTNHSDSDVGTMFPISHDLIVATGGIHGEAGLVEMNDILGIRQINKAIFNQSDMIAGRSRELIKSLAGLRKQSAS